MCDKKMPDRGEITLRRYCTKEQVTMPLASFVERMKLLQRERLMDNFPKKSRKDWDEGRGFDYGIYEGNSNQFMGCIGAHTIRWEHDCSEIGFWISGEFEGKGFISESVAGIESE